MPSLNTSLTAAGLTIALTALTACVPGAADTPADTSAGVSSMSSVMTQTTSYEGTVQRAGISIYQEGTHRLYVDDGSMVLLQSSVLELDDYIDFRVRVTGTAEPTVEAGGTIVTVLSVEELEGPSSQPSVILPDESSSSAETIESSSSSAVASVAASSVSSLRSSAAASSVVAAQSSAAAVVAASSDAGTPADAKTAAMAKAKVEASVFSQQYCSRHVGFCVPVHKNWYYYSFGATSSFLWHVEVSSEEIQNLGDGPLIINLVAGDLPDAAMDGKVQAQGDFVIGYRAWTNSRHFEVSAPAALQAAVDYITKTLSAYNPVTEGSSSAASSL